MRRLGGQAVRHLLGVLLATLVVSVIAIAALGWWLGAHPIAVPWLAERIQLAADQALGPGSVRIGEAAVGWDGFHTGDANPFAIRLTDVAARLPGVERFAAKAVAVDFEILPLLHGVLRPRTVRVEHASLVLAPLPADGGPNHVPADLSALLGRPLPFERPPWVRSLRALTIDDARLALGPTVLAADLGAAATPERDGTLRLSAAWSARPADLASLAPGLAPLARLDAPLSLRLSAAFDADGRPLAVELLARAAAGRITLAAAPVPLAAASLSAAFSPHGGVASVLDVALRPGDAAPLTHLHAAMEAAAAPPGAHRFTVHGAVSLDRIAFADLGRVWPEGVARDLRTWLTQNVTTGVASAFAVDARGAIDGDGSNLVVQSIAGGGTGSDLTVHWLPPVPPVEHAGATLVILDSDRVRVDFGNGQEQAAPGLPPLLVQQGHLLITGLTQTRQVGDVQAHITGSVPSAVALLSHRRLHLLSDHPIGLHNPTGDAVADITVTLPLDARDTMDDVRIAAAAQLRRVAMTNAAAGLPFSNGSIRLTADTEGLAFNGSGQLGSIAGQFEGVLDFRAGPPSQIVQRIEAQARTDLKALSQFGVDPGDLATGPAELEAVAEQQRDGAQTVLVRADLTGAALRLDPLGWSKPPGVPAHLGGELILGSDGRITRIDGLDGEGEGFALRGGVRFHAAGPATLSFERIMLGATEAHGTITLGDGGHDVRADLSGPVVDLGPRLRGDGGPQHAGDARDSWALNARFARALLLQGRTASGLTLEADGTGALTRSLRLRAETSRGERMEATITPERSGRALRVGATDGGMLLRGLGIIDSIEGGRLSIAARYDDSRADHPLAGTAELDDFRLRGAPVVAKILQGASLYGLVQALDGPGTAFTHLVVPFVYAGDTLRLQDARAFNPSLGLTAEGTIDLATKRMRLQGTIVPAYYLNTLPGRIPLIGRLFSPEKGGGLMAARYTATGPLDNPEIGVNPLSALTPGFLRGLFGLGGG
ncbi:MAG TPA: AsmA-like C-terminal region-containing protein [Acetobacteraceae bacterium]|nr:AsmA-like C-terminal region-containing protein [Acetobacteraceae bacterium]